MFDVAPFVTSAAAASAPVLDRPEVQVLLACARTRPDPEGDARLRRLASGTVDWDWICAQAERHGVTPLVYRRLARCVPDRVPAPVMASLQGVSAGVLTHNLRRMAELLRVVKRLESAGIPVMPFKGPLLADVYYGDLGLRRFGDLDVIVRRSDFQRARRVLCEGGYTPYRDLSAAEEADFLDAQLGYEMIDASGQTVVEVHWAFLNRTFAFRLDPDAAWARSRTVAVAGHPVRSLSTEDLLLYLCAHGAKHYWAGLKWVCDVAEVVAASPELDWAALQRRAEALRCERILGLGLHAARRWLGAALPPDVRDAVDADPVIARLAATVERGWLFAETPLEREVSARKVAFTLATRRDVRDSAAFLGHHARLAVQPSPQDRRWIDLPRPLHFLYVALRPIRVLHAFLQRRLGRSAS